MGRGTVTGGLSGGGAGLGQAHGSVTIDMADVQRAVQTARTASRQIEQALGGIDRGTQKAQKSIGGLGASLKGLAGTFGVGLGIAGALGLAQGTLELAKTAAEAERTRGAFDRLAQGIGESSDQMLASMRAASDGMISDQRLVQTANQALLLNAANTGEEMAKLLEIARVRAEASGKSFEDAFSRLALGIGKREPEILDELGIVLRLPAAYSAYAAEVGKTAEQLTEVEKTQALYNAVVKQSEGLLQQSGGAVDDNAKKFDRAAAASQNARIALGNLFADNIAQAAQNYADVLAGIVRLLNQIGAAQPESFGVLEARRFGANIPTSTGPRITASGFGGSMPRGLVAPEFDAAQLADQRAAKLDFAQEIADIERDSANQRLDATRNYESQRTDTIASYERTIAREAEDFGRQRARAQAQFQKQVAELAESAAEREADMAEDLADRIADLQAGASERITEAQDNTNKRISEIEEDYRKSRERAERDHRDNLLDAAARLDATAVFNEQKRFAREQADAKDARDEAISDAQEGLQERIEQERDNLAERIAQEQEAHAERLQEARDADAERLADMQADFAEQQRLEDEDRAVRLQRMAEDHAAQLASMAAAQAEQMAEIDRAEAEELRSAQEAHLKELEEAGIFNKNWKAIQDAREREALQSWDRFWQEFNGRLRMQGPQTPAQAQANQWQGIQLADPSTWNFSSAPPATRGGDVRNFNASISVFAAPGQSAESVAGAVRAEMVRVFRELAN